MDYSGVRAFVTVAREGNITRAAERLFVTQPALSLQLKKLQEVLGVRLFERMPRGMRLTEAGHKLLPAAERALTAAAEFRAAATGLEGSVTGRLRLGTIVDPEFLRMGPFLRLLVERHPGLSFELQHGMSGAVARELEAGNLDVAYGLGAPGMEEQRRRFHVVSLTEFVYRVVAPPGWAAQVRGRGWRDLARLPWIGTPPESVHSRLLGRIFAAEGVEQRVVARVDLEPSMMDLVRSGVALALARDSLALRAAHAEGVAIADAVSVPAELGLMCRPERREEAPVAAAMAIVTEIWRGGDGLD
ncbi:MAG: LysR family transcriptional regulator [Rhodocyclaceae bacterium]|nr:LysR family transcriptional regulator [Rhodocyclaceae bacterium]